jgi:hypothetical protein
MTVFCSNTGWALKLQLSSPLALIAGKLVLLVNEQITALLTPSKPANLAILAVHKWSPVFQGKEMISKQSITKHIYMYHLETEERPMYCECLLKAVLSHVNIQPLLDTVGQSTRNDQLWPQAQSVKAEHGLNICKL